MIVLIQEIERFLKAPVIGVKQLRAFAGAASFVAGLVPIMRPFLNPIWASLSKDVTTRQGQAPNCRKVGAYQESGPGASLDSSLVEG